jgi:NADH-quinone oxidoreductase subunit L
MAVSVVDRALRHLRRDARLLLAPHPAERFSELGGGAPFRLLHNKWYVDELYDATSCAARSRSRGSSRGSTGPSSTASSTARRHWFRTLGELDGAFDKYVVDGAVNAIADGTYAFGRTLKQVQSGAINAYVIVIASGVAGGIFIFYTLDVFPHTDSHPARAVGSH